MSDVNIHLSIEAFHPRGNSQMDLSFQLYSTRKVATPAQAILKLAEMGYRQVESYGAAYLELGATQAALQQTGVTMPSGHFGLKEIKAEPDKVVEIARALGIAHVICPSLGGAPTPEGAEGWRAFGRELNGIAQWFHRRGLRFSWHNHDGEFSRLSDGSVPMEILLEEAPDLGWQIDVAWVIVAGADPLDWIARHAARLTSAHGKDMAAPGHGLEEDGWCDFGTGQIDWKSVISALKLAGVTQLVLEHDNPADGMRFARNALAAAKGLTA